MQMSPARARPPAPALARSRPRADVSIFIARSRSGRAGVNELRSDKLESANNNWGADFKERLRGDTI